MQISVDDLMNKENEREQRVEETVVEQDGSVFLLYSFFYFITQSGMLNNICLVKTSLIVM